MPAGVLFVCHGNICRSPYAEVAFRRLTPRAWGDAVPVHSAGFIGPNRPSPATAVKVAGRRGVHLEAHRSRLVGSGVVKEADLVVVMSAPQARAVRRLLGLAARQVLVLGDLDPGSPDRREIRDPVDGPEALFEAVYARIDACLEVMAGALTPAGDA
jgi:protein-tyrosine phosphatase